MPGPSYHGRTHGPDGTDPIPATATEVGPIDSTENVGDEFGVHSEDAVAGFEPENYVLTSDGLGGSMWAPAAAGVSDPFADVVNSLSGTRDLRGYWRLGEGATPYADTSGHAGGPKDMALTGSGTAMTQDYNPGGLPSTQDDGSVAFNGAAYNTTAEYLATSDTRFQLSALSGYSLAAWVKPFYVPPTNNLMVLGNWTAVNGGHALFIRGGTGQIAFVRGDTSTSAAIDGPAIPVDSWSFVVGVYGPTSGDLRIYVNGVLGGFYNVSQGIAAVSACRIGGNGSGGSDKGSFRGGVDEASVWGDALTASEVAQLAVAGGLSASPGYLAVVSVGAAYTASSNDDVILANATFTVTLPTAVGIGGKQITIKNIGAGTVTVGRTSSQTIDATAADLTLAPLDSVAVMSDANNWQILGSYP